MKTYDLYLDSGPKMKKTMVQVPELTGCIARGDTTEEAIANTPDAIRAFLRFLARHGAEVDADVPFKTRVAEHYTDSGFPAGGMSFLPPDEKPLSPRDADGLMERLGWIHDGLREMTSGMSARQLGEKPASGRPIARILSHICGEGAYLRGVRGASRIQRLVDKGELDAHEALDELLALEKERLASMPSEERKGMIMRGHSPWSARSAVRRMLEHGWEHYVEIADRLGRAP